MCGRKHKIESMDKKRIVLYKLDEQREILETFRGLDRAALSVDGNSPNLLRAIKNDRKYKGFYWKKLTDENKL